MAGSRREEDDIQALKSLHSTSVQTGLNLAFRKALEETFPPKNISFAQDDIGNIWITRPGTDASLSGIAISFPLDSPSPNQFCGALHTFLRLQQIQTKCDVSLLGWSSPNGSTIGYDVWEEIVSIEEAYERYTELKSFLTKDDASKFSLSALLEVVENDEAEVVVKGSPLLADKARSAINASVNLEGGGPTSSRCPVISIRGEEAVSVAAATISAYSNYVAALFENFE